MSRRTKQATYGIFYLAILAAIVAGIYFLFLKPPPPPPCTNCVPSTLQPISALGKVNIFSPTKGRVTLLAQVENANSDFAAYSFDYVITLYGVGGSTAVATFPGSSFAYANEIKYIVLPNEPIGAAVSRADIAVSNIQWVPSAQMGLIPQFSFTNITGAAGTPGYMVVSADVTNRDVSLFKNIVVVAVFKDALRTAIGASQTVIDSLAPGATQHFSISYPLLPNESISATELKAYAER